MEDVKKVLLTKSKRSKMEQRGKFISFLCIALIVLVVLSIFYFVASKGLATFFTDKINVFDFLFGTDWNPSQIGANGKPMVGALPMITGSFIVTFLSAIVATPFAIGAAVFMTEISPKNGTKILQPVIELLVGIPSVVYGFIGYRAFCQKYFWRDRVWYLSWYICVVRYDLADCHNDDC
ncbi:hypothetical protein EfmAA610_21420 [Enterococcus faecium]|nr:hypothetical protein EfmAA610_21420 [Enterococcus faecium]